jgi:hypothetical protein
MRKIVFIMLIACVAFIGCKAQEAEAHSITNVTNIVAADTNSVAGVKLDAPNLVQLSENTTLGLEGGKDIMKDVFHDDTRDYFEADKGYFAYLKVTYTGCLLNCKGE